MAALHTLSVLFVLTLLGQKLEEGLRTVIAMPAGTLSIPVLLAYWLYLASSIRRWTDKAWTWVALRLVLVIGGTVVVDMLVSVAAMAATLATLARASH